MRRAVAAALALTIVQSTVAPSSFALALMQTTAGPSTKPTHRQVQTVCANCLEKARLVNQAYDGLNYLWDRKLALMKSIGLTEQAIAARAADIAKLEAATPPSGRTASQQSAIDALKQINRQQREGIARQQRELAELDGRIKEQNGRIDRLLAELKECEQRCATPPADPPLTSTAGSKPEITTTESGGVSAIAVPCPQCQRYADLILDLQEERAEVLSDLERLELEADVLFGLLLNRGDARLLVTTTRSREAVGEEIEDAADELAGIEANLLAAWAALTVCIMNCNLVPSTPLYKRPYVIGPVIGVGVLGGVILGGGEKTGTPPAASTTPPAVPTPQTPAPAPAPTPPAPTPGCSAASGDYSFTGTIRMPRACFVIGTSPVFASPIAGTMTVQLDQSCSGTVTVRHPNTWTFAYSVSANIAGSSIQVRTTTPFMNTQPFGVPFNSSIELTVTGNAVIGTETHMSSNCTDVYGIEGMRR